MEMLNVGGLELIFVAAFAFIIFGPARTIEFMGQIGSLLGSIKRNYNLLITELNATMPVEDTLKNITEELKDTKRDFKIEDNPND
jgi:Sec-independent protein translocase protein TatA